MGTNFYAIIPVKQRIADKLKKLSNELVNGTDIDSYKDELKNIQKEISECQVHLGKRSCGWSFCWDANNLKYYKPSLISIKEFIKENNAIIQNEYGEEFSWEQFIKDEIGYCLYVGEKTIKTKDGDYIEIRRGLFHTHVTLPDGSELEMDTDFDDLVKLLNKDLELIDKLKNKIVEDEDL